MALLSAATPRTQRHVIEGLILFVAPLIAFVAGASFSLLIRAHTFHSIKVIHTTNIEALKNASAKAIVAAWGKPDQTQTKNGVICVLYNGRKVEICYAA